MTAGSGATHGGERWGSRLGFVAATAGSAVGLGNIWRFPSLAAENGGGAFVALFLLVILVIGVPALMAELALGRRAKRNALDAFLFTVVDAVSSDLLLPLAGLLTAVFVGWVWGAGAALDEVRRGAGRFPERLWAWSVRLVIPVTIGIILVAGLLGVR